MVGLFLKRSAARRRFHWAVSRTAPAEPIWPESCAIRNFGPKERFCMFLLVFFDLGLKLKSLRWTNLISAVCFVFCFFS